MSELLVMACTHQCDVPGCSNVALNGRYCTQCIEEMIALTALGMQVKARKRRSASDWICALTVVGVWCWLLWDSRSFWIELFSMWFGRGM
ncbi:hypothetical protein ACOBR2_06530 [Telmatobacter bradus]|uniref:hypothetical protein n=1 Tax=Telmatobacter bradus TaxID=474953 RepID=UPI003B42BF2A